MTTDEHNPTTGCRQRDDWLFGLLPSASAAEFEQHLDRCSACRTAVAGEHRMKQRVRVALQQAAEPRLLQRPAGHGASSARTGRRMQRRLAVLSAVASLAAAALMAALPWPVRSPPSRSQRSVDSAVATAATTADELPRRSTAPRPRVTVPDDAVAVSLESADPNVVVMLICPAVRTADQTPMQRDSL